jgi:hypothetical protein
VEIAGVAVGLGGLAAAALMGVCRSPKIGKPVSRVGVPYAIFWIAVIGGRAASPPARLTGSPPRLSAA